MNMKSGDLARTRVPAAYVLVKVHHAVLRSRRGGRRREVVKVVSSEEGEEERRAGVSAQRRGVRIMYGRVCKRASGTRRALSMRRVTSSAVIHFRPLAFDVVPSLP